jgi:hypothetical protein
MNRKESNNQFKALHCAILRTHAVAVKKRLNLGEASRKVNAPMGNINPEDMANYMLARMEASEAHLTWANTQLRYFQYIEKAKSIS